MKGNNFALMPDLCMNGSLHSHPSHQLREGQYVCGYCTGTSYKQGASIQAHIYPHKTRQHATRRPLQYFVHPQF